MPALSLCLLCTLVTVVPAAPVGGAQPAQHEELTLLFHGALQLGQALNGVYKGTEDRLMEAGRSMGLFDQALQLLGMKVHEGRDAAQKLRTNLLEMQTEEDALQLRAEATAQLLGEVAQAQQVLRDNVKQLEGQLRGAWLGQSSQQLETIKAHTEKQSHQVWALTGHLQRQRREMAKLQQWLRQIQERSLG
ncbi:angiopoietin-like protein 8 isoform X2 [Perognathus longimembris pacificus]|uniref:angiopoietin-like protein 8 isoform X2 n=1 Tax=Perognathus longimembris pacificus TaxID=214514 RepID=UPI0020187589|nr:angiopoietin-like protein 8 isoform X2 [Perognathus longimembris pacificus]